MQTKTPKQNERIETADLPSDMLPLGNDAERDVHFFSRIAAEVIVVDSGGTIQQRQDLTGRTLEEWIDYVDEERGWELLHYRESFADILTDALGSDQ